MKFEDMTPEQQAEHTSAQARAQAENAARQAERDAERAAMKGRLADIPPGLPALQDAVVELQEQVRILSNYYDPPVDP